MNFINSKDDKIIYGDFAKLYKEAFPKEERPPLFYLKAKAKKSCSDSICIYDGKKFAGLLNLIYHKDLVYVFFFAVAKDLRGKGCGTRILSELKDMFPGRRLALNIEATDDECGNLEQRVKRKSFYLKNGFEECGYNLTEKGVKYEMLSYGGKVKAEEFKELLKNYMGSFLFRIYYKFP